MRQHRSRVFISSSVLHRSLYYIFIYLLVTRVGSDTIILLLLWSATEKKRINNNTIVLNIRRRFTGVPRRFTNRDLTP